MLIVVMLSVVMLSVVASSSVTLQLFKDNQKYNIFDDTGYYSLETIDDITVVNNQNKGANTKSKVVLKITHFLDVL